MSGIGNGDLAHGWINQSLHADFFDVESRTASNPQDQMAHRIGEDAIRGSEALFDQAARIVHVSGEKDVKRSAVCQLCKEVAGGAVRNSDFDIGVLVVKSRHHVVEGKSQIRCGRDGQDGCLRSFPGFPARA
jgi:hypothetical protein